MERFRLIKLSGYTTMSKSPIKMNISIFVILLFLFFSSFNTTTQVPILQPISKQDFKYISSNFGWRNHPIRKKYHFHSGIDIVTKNKNAAIYATADGYIKELNYSKEGLGLYIVIEHINDIETVYAHLSDIRVLEGSKVKAGQMIANIGTTGSSTGEHLHYEIRFDGVALDPVKVIERLKEKK